MNWPILWQQALTAVLSGSVVAAVVGLLFHRRTKAIEQQLRVQAEAQIAVSLSTREWQEAMLGRVLGPVFMHLLRTRRAYDRWKDLQLFLEMEVVGRSNRYIRDLLLENGHLIPADLTEHAIALVEHYDAWLEEFEQKRRSENPDLKTKFIFVGPKGYGFPHAAEQAFIARFHQQRRELYGKLADRNVLPSSRKTGGATHT